MRERQPQTLVELLRSSVSTRPEREVLRFKQGKVWVGMSATEVLDQVRSIALGLYGRGVRKGDRVAILAESGPLWSITDYAILANGAVNVPIYPTQPPNQVEYILRES